jgi:4-amino-4-deoxy-L-arabinose transferase-like glycosyltransferase
MPSEPISSAAPPRTAIRRRFDIWVVPLIIVIVSVIYGSRLARQPIVGEESRWANGAREMLSSGDWIVPRQQGRVFPERPPMTMWAMAAAGYLRGGVDPIAIRLPSVIAVVLTSLLVYAYARALLSPIAAIAGALVYASLGQVLQIGRLGESEALFALLVSASLLLWHLGYSRGWRPLATWCTGFAFAAFAALVKGPQAPVYFGAITATYVLVERDWRFIVRWQFAAGALLFASIIAAWQIPFYLATDWPTVVATWSGLAADRIHLGGLARHFVTYPVETFVCLLPWSPLLFALLKQDTRALLRANQPATTFLFVALLVAYPTVWAATGARGRYFMPLYPVAAVLIGFLVERCASAAVDTYPNRAWRQFLMLAGAIIAVSGAVVGASGLLPGDAANWLYQPRWFELAFSMLAAIAVYLLWRCYRSQNALSAIAAVGAVAVFAGIAFSGVMVNINSARWNNLTPAVADLKTHLPEGAALVSFSPIEHRFAYYYGLRIEEYDWPMSVDDVPPNIEYFCFMRYAGDTAERRASGRGRTWTTTPGTLPFAWEELTTFCVERRSKPTGPHVVLARIVRPLQAEVSDVTVPRSRMAQGPDAVERR